VLRDSLDSFPVDYRKIIETVSKTFSYSPQRNDLLRECIAKLQNTDPELDIVAIKQYVPTRWTSIKDCLDRILRLWSPLKLYFEENAQNEAEKKLFTPHNLCMLKLLQSLTTVLTQMIKEFEVNNLEILEIVKMLKEHLISIAKFVLKINPALSH